MLKCFNVSFSVTLKWQGLFPLFTVDYGWQLDDLLRALQKAVEELADPDLDRRGVYALVSGSEADDDSFEIEELLYIGVAFGNDLSERIHDRRAQGREYRNVIAECRDRVLYLAHGHITETTGGKMPPKLLSAVHCALVYWHEPLCNSGPCMEAYQHGTIPALEIVNTGDFLPLEDRFVVPQST